MEKNIIAILFILLTIGLYSCKDMNSIQDQYLENGEIDYVGRLDSIKTYSGKDRIKFEYWITDPRSTKLHITWNQPEAMEKTITIPVHEASEMLEYTLGGDSDLVENNYTFIFVSESDAGVLSIPMEVLGNVYGDMYQESLTSRRISDINYVDDILKITYNEETDETNIGVRLNYFNVENEPVVIFYGNDELASQIEITDIDPTKGATYQTAYLPEETAIDTFFTEPVVLEIKQITNVALGKAVTISGKLRDGFEGEKAVDGNITDTSSRWLNANVVGDHWLIVDLGQEYAIDKLKLYINSPEQAPDYKLQIDVNGEWQDVATVTGDLEGIFEKTMDPVNTSKVRLFFNTTETSKYLRLFEIEAYSTITY